MNARGKGGVSVRKCGEVSRGDGDAVAEEVRDGRGRRWKMLEMTGRREGTFSLVNVCMVLEVPSGSTPVPWRGFGVALTLQRRE